MASVLDAIRDAWIAESDLTDWIPEDRVFVGPPNPGTPMPCLGFVSESNAGLTRSSSTQYLTISVQAVAEADDPETLESVCDAIREHLHTWTCTRFAAMQVKEVVGTIARDDESPRRSWIADIQILCDAYRK